MADIAVREIHDDDYVDFLLDISKEIEGEEEYVPPIFREDLRQAPLYFRGGMYCTEIGTPIGKDCLEASKYILENDNSAFVLTRPPGHHAGKRRYGGYCFFNNAYLAANEFVKNGKKVAVLDIDYHIGDGSIEFATKEAPYHSLHANVWRNYPYVDAAFEVKNEFVTLKEFKTGISGEVYVEYVREFVTNALKNPTEIMILSLGFDTLGTDYTQDEYIYVKPENFRTIGEIFGSLKQEVLILLEGGYDSEYLELCAFELMSGFISKKSL
ncbi:Deacetylases, including yeast histone deacetylase and acetoin utilization protein [hydrothermal vent metagenome]|uniref:Deacetylases, including yeast histone deacetylase and acetoin utilization protein n=1 Tax=hydrothermal vent metagenome TaxID=652676 RepID=A0A1W1CL80_9ZZZZ